ncbi:unnamed protein product [Mesocestoides corti]|uniref:ATP synthase subunit f, mitochondrial n=2 Tax=Mesocestoides corti TaxID=53468 RepID=A0A0R3UA50_MESCO|nr:unnamed protein product [Mesocestoides corti]
MTFFGMNGLGLLPKEYNVRVHGAYFPGYYYGPKETKLGDVKLGDLKAWLKTRSLDPMYYMRALARFTWRYRLRWIYPRNTTLVPFFHLGCVFALCQYVINYKSHQTERHAKYH